MKFQKEILQSLANDYLEDGVTEDQIKQFEVVQSELVETSRWSILYNMVFKFAGKYYSSNYSVGATEQQDESAYEFDPDFIECQEVEPVEVTVTEYQPV